MAGPALRKLILPVAVAAAVVAGVEVLHLGRLDRPPAALELREALFEPEGGEPLRVSLPHDWRATHPQVRSGRYRLSAPAAQGGAVGLYFPNLPTDTEVRLNGALVHASDRFTSLPTRLWDVPVYVGVPAALLRAEGNELELRVREERPGDGYLPPPALGPDALLRPRYELRHLLQVGGVQILMIAMLAFAGFMTLLWLRRRRESAYLWFAVVLGIWAVGLFNLVAMHAWLPKPSWNWIGTVSMAWLAVASAIFTFRMLGRRYPRLEAGVALAALAGSVFFAAASGTRLYDAARPVWGLIVLSAGVFPALLVAREFLRNPTRDLQLMVAAGLLLLGCGAHDVLMANGGISLEHDFASTWAAFVGMGLFAWIFATRFVAALDTSEALTAHLEQRVAEKSAELAGNYERLRALEHERLLARERERITAEIHDGLGGQLVSTLALVRSGEANREEVEDALQSALDDMRLMIHSLGDEEADLLTLLATLRGRLGARLERGGIRVDWAVEDVPMPADFGPQKALQVLRIVQEAITNVVKHSGARVLRVRTGGVESGAGRCAFVVLEDDGCGLPPGAAAAGGRGLANMRRRAERLGARLEVRSGAAGGVVVRLELPLAGAPDSPSIPDRGV